MNKSLFTLSLLIATFLLVAGPVKAAGQPAVVCTPIYGGGQTCVQAGFITIDKKVQKPGTNEYVDNLTVNDPKFAPGDTFNFRITVTNTGGTMIPKVTVRDILPAEVTFVAGPGAFDANSRTFSADMLNLNPTESRTIFLTVKANQLGANEMQKCEIVNKAVAIVDGELEDHARFCIQQAAQVTKGGLKVFPPAQVVTTPPTGPEALALIGLIPSGIAGYFLRRKASK